MALILPHRWFRELKRCKQLEVLLALYNTGSILVKSIKTGFIPFNLAGKFKFNNAYPTEFTESNTLHNL